MKTKPNFLLAIINSDVLQEAVQPFMSKGQFGARDLHKHLWRLPIPEYDPGDQLHLEIAQAGASAATGAADQLAALRKARGDRLTSTIARRELAEVAARLRRRESRGERRNQAAGRRLNFSHGGLSTERRTEDGLQVAHRENDPVKSPPARTFYRHPCENRANHLF